MLVMQGILTGLERAPELGLQSIHGLTCMIQVLLTVQSLHLKPERNSETAGRCMSR